MDAICLISSTASLRVMAGKANPTVSSDRLLYLFQGDVTREMITSLKVDEGIVLPERAEKLDGSPFHLTVYHFNDLHGHLVRFSPAGEDPVISRMAGRIRSKNAEVKDHENQAVITLSAGDDSIGSIFDELLGSSPQDFQLHASYALYTAMGVDAACLGNHDFDLGSAILKRSIQANAKFPILAANLSGCPDFNGICFPAALLVVKGIRIGLIGLVTQAELKNENDSCQVSNPIEVVQNILPVLKPICDVIIIISHLGYSLVNSSVPMINSGDVELAQSLSAGAVHLIVGGHSHHELNAQGLSPKNIVNGIPIVQTGSLGHFLGQVDLRISPASSAVKNVRLLPINYLPVDLQFEEKYTQPILSQARALFDRPLGEVGDDPELSTENVRTSFASGELALANFITDAMLSQLQVQNQHVDLAMIDSSSLRQGLIVGHEVTLGNWFNVMPFADTIRIYRLSGWQLNDLLQDNALRMDRPNEPHTERGFLQFGYTVRYQIALGDSRADARALNILVNGKQLTNQLDTIFSIAGTSFVREYASSWELLDDQHRSCQLIDLDTLPFVDTDVFLRRELVRYIQGKGGISAATGAHCDGRLQVLEKLPEAVSQFTIRNFVEQVSQEKHAMAGAVIALCAAQAVALGKGCVGISQQRGSLSLPEVKEIQENIQDTIDRLLILADLDANAIADFVTKREINRDQDLERMAELCSLPFNVCHLTSSACMLLQDFRPHVHFSVRDDLEMSINLLAASAKSAMLLLDSNLRIWADREVAQLYEPRLQELLVLVRNLTPVERIRQDVAETFIAKTGSTMSNGEEFEV